MIKFVKYLIIFLLLLLIINKNFMITFTENCAIIITFCYIFYIIIFLTIIIYRSSYRITYFLIFMT
ncbi:hypothetical protein HSACCH_00251 [Halanaerobium saccharolyticum subsp. saccharolyticum DSM 6643]|uniref:Uncharacterized protein n=1 Tax=Halanaerobium saccharolyticum subsp. saccharolyticum DSM 6643 TaxID=1293054 RepID=M5EAX8_9FIRM|nr:hypothetical protein HSACCH_00251 [Halanaerobium saccharolyticum subsp. saccharolyticum DSM 6643]